MLYTALNVVIASVFRLMGKQDLKELPESCKVRRVSNTHLSPRQHTEGLALLASDADSGESAEVFVLATGDGTKRRQRFSFYCCYLAGLQCTQQPDQLELMVRLLEKVQLTLLRGYWLQGFCNSCYEAKQYPLACRMFLLVCWCQRTSTHCTRSCGGACVTMLVTLGGKRRWTGCSCE